MANKRIIEHTASTTISNDDWLLKDSATGGTTKILASVLRTLLGGDNFASTYDSSLTYYTGNMCIYNGILYKCNAFSGTTGTFDSSKWTQVTITDYASKLLASDWRATSSYVRDDLVSYRGSIYRCASDSATVGTFVNTEWITANWDSIRIVLLRNNIAKEYDGSEIYNKGDLVFESPYYLCVCKENGVTGAFDTSKWITDGTISDALELVDEQIIENIAGEYDSEVEYSKDALCFNDGVLYIANADTTGTWDSTKWNATTIADIIANLRIDANDVVDVKVKGYSLVNSSKIAVLDSLTAQGSASGSIASFSDGSTHPMSKLEIGIEPQQDLHGYDHPWVGGAGKNKCDLSAFTHTGVVDDEGGETTLNNRLFSVHIPIKSGTTYTLSLMGSKNGENIYANRIIYFDSNDTFIERYTPASQIQTVSFTTLSNAKYIQIDLRTASLLSIEITDISKIQVEEGDSTAYEPYSNICPISGWEECNVSVSGVNVWDEEWEVGSITDNGTYQPTQTIRSKNFNSIKPNTNYKIVQKNGGTPMRVCFYDKSKNFINRTTNVVSDFTTPSNCYYFKLTSTVAYGDTYNNDISVNYPSTDTEYHAYNGHTYNIQFKDRDNPLTVYGGTLDVVSGELTVDRAMTTFNGSENWVNVGGSYPFAFQLDTYLRPNSKNQIGNISSLYPWTTVEVPTNNAIRWQIDTPTGRLYVYDYTYTADLTGFKAMLQTTPLQVCYYLATPITYQLTPTQVRSLLGTNNVWADTGDVNEAVYTRDLNITVNDIISRIEALENA